VAGSSDGVRAGLYVLASRRDKKYRLTWQVPELQCRQLASWGQICSDSDRHEEQRCPQLAQRERRDDCVSYSDQVVAGLFLVNTMFAGPSNAYPLPIKVSYRMFPPVVKSLHANDDIAVLRLDE